MMTNSKRKGARRERELATLLRQLGFKGARRGVQYQGTPDSPDVVDAIPGVHIECKGNETLNIWQAMRQAIADAGDDDVPVVMHKKSREPWLITCRLVELIGLAKLALPHDPDDPDNQPSEQSEV